MNGETPKSQHTAVKKISSSLYVFSLLSGLTCLLISANAFLEGNVLPAIPKALIITGMGLSIASACLFLVYLIHQLKFPLEKEQANMADTRTLIFAVLTKRPLYRLITGIMFIIAIVTHSTLLILAGLLVICAMPMISVILGKISDIITFNQFQDEKKFSNTPLDLTTALFKSVIFGVFINSASTLPVIGYLKKSNCLMIIGFISITFTLIMHCIWESLFTQKSFDLIFNDPKESNPKSPFYEKAQAMMKDKNDLMGYFMMAALSYPAIILSLETSRYKYENEF